MVDVITYRTDDGVRWGTGAGADLDPHTVDVNFWALNERVTTLETTPAQPVGIDHFIVSGNQMTVVMTDGTTRGPYTLPTSEWRFVGAWAPSTVYLFNDVVTANGSVYLVLQNHTSATSFDPGAIDSSGHQLYGLLLTNPANVLPAGGATNQVLMKSSSADYAVMWSWNALANLHDVSLTSPINGNYLSYNGTDWVNAPFPSAELVPAGGAAGQVLTKHTSTNYDVVWADAGAGGGGTAHISMEDLTDVAIGGTGVPNSGDVLVFGSGVWRNQQNLMRNLIDCNTLVATPTKYSVLMNFGTDDWSNWLTEILLGEHTIVAGSVMTTVQFQLSSYPSAFNGYKFRFKNLLASASNIAFLIQIMVGGVVETTGYVNVSGRTDGIDLIGAADIQANTDKGLTGEVTIMHVQDGTTYKKMAWGSGVYYNGTGPVKASCAGWWDGGTTGPISTIYFTVSAGGYNGGSIQIYGIP